MQAMQPSFRKEVVNSLDFYNYTNKRHFYGFYIYVPILNLFHVVFIFFNI